MPKIKYSIGIDEAGRGPLAGPVAVGIALVPRGFRWRQIPGVTDSKKLSEKNREAIFLRAHALKKSGVIDFAVLLISSKTIDRIGISNAVMEGIVRGLKKISKNPEEVEVLLDGLLHAPDIYKRQKTIIGGDAKEKVIGLASICAKVTRDRYMVRLSKKYPEYQFHIHKGYGTKLHREAITTYGLSKVHRRSFCKRFLP